MSLATSPRILPVGTILSVLFLGLACGCAPATPLVRVESRNFRFSLPSTVPGGLVRVRLVNRDPVWHEASIVRFEHDTASLASYLAAARAGDEYPGFSTDLGGVSLLAPGDSADILLRLTPGRYAMICWHRDHVLQGMGSEFTVAAAPSEIPPPTADDEMVLGGSTLRPFTPDTGRALLHIRNTGPGEHELIVLQLAPGASLEDYLQWREAGEIGPAPARTLAGSAALAIGAEVWVEVPWTPGRYLLLCLLEDTRGQLHALQGEQLPVDVNE